MTTVFRCTTWGGASDSGRVAVDGLIPRGNVFRLRKKELKIFIKRKEEKYARLREIRREIYLVPNS